MKNTKDIIVEVLEEHEFNLSDKVINTVSEEITKALEDDKHSLWSKDAFSFLNEVVIILENNRNSIKEDTLERRELGVLIYKIQEHLNKLK